MPGKILTTSFDARIVLDPLPADATIEDAKERIAGLHLAHDEALRTLVEALPEEVQFRLVASLRDQAGKGFRTIAYDEAADTILYEIGLRRSLDEAKASGLSIYCLSCAGECGPNHDAKAAAKHRPMSAEELRIRSLSREDIIAELLALKGLPEG